MCVIVQAFVHVSGSCECANMCTYSIHLVCVSTEPTTSLPMSAEMYSHTTCKCECHSTQSHDSHSTIDLIFDLTFKL